MAQPCSICTHPDRQKIDQEIIKGTSLRDIAGQFGTTKSSISRHKDHLPDKLVKAAETREINEAGTLLDQLVEINTETKAILKEMRTGADKDNRGALFALRRLEKQLELQAQLIGKLQPPNTITIINNPQWVEIRTVILRTLEPFPEARARLVEALAGVQQ